MIELELNQIKEGEVKPLQVVSIFQMFREKVQNLKA